MMKTTIRKTRRPSWNAAKPNIRGADQRSNPGKKRRIHEVDDADRREPSVAVSSDEARLDHHRDKVIKAHQKLDRHQATYIDQFEDFRCKAILRGRRDGSTAFGPVYMDRGRQITRQIIEAEQKFHIAEEGMPDSKASSVLEDGSTSVITDGIGNGSNDDFLPNWRLERRVFDWMRNERSPAGPTSSEFDQFEQLEDVEVWDSLSMCGGNPTRKSKIRSWERQNRTARPKVIGKRRGSI